MTDSVLLKILSNTYTEHDFYYRVDMLQEALENVFYNSDEEDDARQLPSAVAYMRASGHGDLEPLFLSWGNEVFSSFNPMNLYKNVSALKDKGDALDRVTLFIPFLFDEDAIRELGEWVRRHVSETALIEVSIDEDIVGGCAIAWKGTYHDFSFDRLFREHRDQIVDVINVYGHAG